MTINEGIGWSSSGNIAIHHAAGVSLAQAHAAAKSVANVVIRETFKQTDGTITSFGYRVKA